MFQRSSLILLEILATLIAGLVIVAGALFWRLSGDEPLRLRFLTPYLEEALTAPDGSFAVRIQDTVLTWAGWSRALDLRVVGVRAVAGERQIASLPEISISISAKALLRGRVEPNEIEFFRPRLYILRGTDGRFRFGHDDGGGLDADLAGGESPIVRRLLAELVAAPGGGTTTSYLTRASIVDGLVQFDDRLAGMIWRAPQADIVLERRDGGVAGALSLAVDNLGDPARVHAKLNYDTQSGRIALAADLSQVDAATLGFVEPALSFLAGSDLVLAGRAETRIDIDGRIGATRFEMSSGAGHLSLPDLLSEPLTVSRLALVGELDENLDSLVVSGLTADLGGPRLALTATATGLLSGAGSPAPALTVVGKVQLEQVPVDDLGRFWPIGVAPNPRAWVVANLSEGIADRAEATFAVRLPDGVPEDAIVDQLAGTFRVAGVTVRYLGQMPPIRNASGEGRFSVDDLVLTFRDGIANGLTIDSGRLKISDFTKPVQPLHIEGSVHGSLRDVLSLLDHPRLGYLSHLGIDPSSADGQVTAELSFDFPTEREIRMADVRIGAKAMVTGGGLQDAAFGQALTGGSLDLDLTEKGMTIDGTVAIGGVPVTLSWVEDFTDVDVRSRIAVTGTTTADQRAELGLDLRPYVDGPIESQILYSRHDGGSATIAATLGLDKAVLAVPFIGWGKPAGEVGRAELLAELRGDRLVGIRSFAVDAGTLKAAGRAAIGATGRPDSVEFDRLEYGQTALRGVVARLDGASIDVTVAGGQLDAAPLLDGRDVPEETGDLQGPEPFSLRADRLSRVLLAPDRQLDNIAVMVRHDGTYWEAVQFDGTLPGGKGVRVRYLPNGKGRYDLSVKTSDAGALLRVFDVVDSVIGGNLTISGNARADEPKRPLHGKVEVTDFRLVRTPVLARLLSIATLTGLVDLLTGEGFLFTSATGNFIRTDGRLDVPLARAHGPSLGLTASGTLDFDAERVDIEGTIVPAYAINSILGNIPLIGNILQGGKGEGLFAATYRMRGALQEPEISVNPLAALAPGFLRGLFGIFDGGGASGSLPPQSSPENSKR